MDKISSEIVQSLNQMTIEKDGRFDADCTHPRVCLTLSQMSYSP